MKWTRALHSRLNILVPFALCFLCQQATMRAQTLTTLVSFNGTDGSQPTSQLVEGLDGNFYGTTGYAGAHGFGTVFKVTPEGTLTTLHNFLGPDGVSPDWLTAATGGNFYGTTLGATENTGTIFKITSTGILTTIARFNNHNGASPNGLIQASDGNFYGSTLLGGDLGVNSSGGCGTIFRVTPAGGLTDLHNFQGTDGCEPYAPPTQGVDGNFYGTTRFGGANYLGTIFKMTPLGDVTTLLNFDRNNGSADVTGLVLGTDGNLYGITNSGGSTFGYNDGVFFRITPDGTFTNLLNLNGAANDPSTLILASDGNFYGASEGASSLFKITPTGALTTLYTFDGVDGSEPRSALLQASDGNFYGTTYVGGTGLGQGTVFSFSVGLAPPIKNNPSFEKAR